MKIKVKQNFYDRENDLALREKGAEMEVSEQRGRELIAKGFVKNEDTIVRRPLFG